MDKDRDRFLEVVGYLPDTLSMYLLKTPKWVQQKAQEIHIRQGSPVTICCHDKIYYLTVDGVSENYTGTGLVYTSVKDIREAMASMCSYSIYTHQQEINNGFISLRGGHRAGICGTAVISPHGEAVVRDISSINLRIARELLGCAESLLERLSVNLEQGILLAGAPASGKTTLLRDMARALSCRERRVAVVDERGELGAVYNGERGYDLGPNCDLLNGYPKGIGIIHALRCLAPEFIVCDELGGEDDCNALEHGIHSGTAFIATVHAGRRDDLLRRNTIRRILLTGAFNTVVLLKDQHMPGQIQDIFRAEDLLDTEHGRNFVDRNRDGNWIYKVQPSCPAG